MNEIATKEARPVVTGDHNTGSAEAAKTKKRLPKGEKLPDIGLATFVMFKEIDGTLQISPEPKKMTATKGHRPVITLGDIPLPAGVPAPAKALTVLYGFRDALDEIKDQYAIARQKGLELIKVEFKLQVHTDHPETKIVIGTSGPEDIPKSRFLNVLRLNMELQGALLDRINERLAKESAGTKKAAMFFETMIGAGARPDLICDAIRHEEMYKHINSVVYSVPDGTPRGRKVCSVFDTSNAIEIIIRGEPPFDIVLPKL